MGFPGNQRLFARKIGEKSVNRAPSEPKINRLGTACRLRYSGSADMATEISKRLFTVHEYHRMVDAGILSEDDRVELIRGEILAMSPIGPRHSAAVLRATQALVRIVGDRAIVGVQGSVRLDEYDEPQPDLYLLRPKADFYASGHAGPAEIFLIIEVADSSLDYDRTIKMRLYAETGVPEYWIADIQTDCVYACSNPEENGYRAIRTVRRGERLTPQLLGDCEIPVDVLLP
jgi:Uma2 family endonuclease